MLERAAFAACARKPSADRDAWEFQDYWWNETVLEGFVKKLVHRHIGLNKRGFRRGVGVEDV